jgi:hypothetical protein
MKFISIAITAFLLTACTSFAHSQSLSELAKKEKERRAALKADSKVITNEKANQALGTVTTPPPTSATTEKPPAEGEQKPATEASAEKPKAVSDEPVDFQGRTESFWRQTFADARKRVKDLENESNVIVLKLNDLQNQFYRENDGYKQQQIQREIQKKFFEQDTNKQALAQAKGDLVDLEREARKSGALPGWIRNN